jgi:protease-4
MDKKFKMSFSDLLKNIFFIIIILQLAPHMIQNIAQQYKRIIEARTQVGVVPVKGVLYESETYCTMLRTYFNDKNIKAILIKMECPGGASGTSQAIFNELKALKHEHPKPVVVLVENMCTSGAYNIACASDYIIAPGSALIGSIGTSLPYVFSVKNLLEKLKITYTPIKSGAFKNVANPFVEITPQEKALLQSITDDAYDQFIHEVSEQRKLPIDHAKDWAEGRVFTGQQAKKIGLIDEIGSLNNAIQTLKRLGNFKGEIEWVRPPQRISLWNLFSGGRAPDQEDGIFTHLYKIIMHTAYQNMYQTPSHVV